LNCFKKLSNKEKEEISQIATKLKFWAKNGYYAFICFILISVISFSLSLLDFLYFYLGIAFVIIDLFYGFWLFNYLTQN
jgi:predicted MFS family arabinose efflux permease